MDKIAVWKAHVHEFHILSQPVQLAITCFEATTAGWSFPGLTFFFFSSFFTPSHLNREALRSCWGTTFVIWKLYRCMFNSGSCIAAEHGGAGLITSVTSSLSQTDCTALSVTIYLSSDTWVGPGFVFVLHIFLHSNLDCSRNMRHLSCLKSGHSHTNALNIACLWGH